MSAGMNAAVRATVRVGLYTGARVFFVHEVKNYIYAQNTKYIFEELLLYCCYFASFLWQLLDEMSKLKYACIIKCVLFAPRVTRV